MVFKKNSAQKKERDERDTSASEFAPNDISKD